MTQLTGYDESKAYPDDAKIPEAPEVHLVEQHTCIDEPAEFIVSKGGNPNIHQRFKKSNPCLISFHKHRIVKKQK
jgi:hypothetical protein